MTLTFYWYPSCGTCKKAKKWFDDNEISYNCIHIVEETPSKEDLLALISKSEFPVKRFFNTSGHVYRELTMKDKLETRFT